MLLFSGSSEVSINCKHPGNPVGHSPVIVKGGVNGGGNGGGDGGGGDGGGGDGGEGHT